MKIFSGSASTELSQEIAKELGGSISPITAKRFSDGETYVKISESVRGHQVFVIQSTGSPVNDNLMELLLIIDALKRASATEINAVIPYFGYARQDRKSAPREPISAKLVADLLQAAGAHRVITFDLHANQIQGFFNIPVDNLEAQPVLLEHFADMKNVCVVSPDVGGTKRARNLANVLKGTIAIIDKRRSEHNKAEVMNLIGDVKGKECIIIDDIIDTAGTICAAVETLQNNGALQVHLCATHGVFTGPAIERLKSSNAKSIVVTNTIPIPEEKKFSTLKIISIAPLLAQCIKSVQEAKPMGAVFDRYYEKMGIKK